MAFVADPMLALECCRSREATQSLNTQGNKAIVIMRETEGEFTTLPGDVDVLCCGCVGW